MNWKEIKLDQEKVYPTSQITVFVMDTASGKAATHWVDKAYQSYEFKSQCMFNCFVNVDLTDEFNIGNRDVDRAEIEAFFTSKLREVCVCHLVARITTDTGISLELYVDHVENAIQKFNELEVDENRLVNFDCEISDDENWTNVDNLLYS